MSHIVTERCVDCRYTDCCTVCPVECFWEIENPAMLVIDPQTCIDCGLCIPECPIYAIYPLDEVPEPYKGWIKKNEELFPKGKNITVKKEPLPTAIPVAQIHEREKLKGLKVSDPSAVGGSSVTTATAKKTEAQAGPKAESTTQAESSVAPAKPLSPQEIAAATIQKKLAAQASAPPTEPARGPVGYRPSPLKLPKPPPRPPLGVHPGGRIRLGFRTGTVQVIRKGRGGFQHDVRILFHGEERPVWYLYSSLQTSKERGELEVLDPGKPSLLQRMFGR